MNEIIKPNGQGYWKEHFKSWKESGVTQQAYCAREGISYQSFIYQQNRAKNKLKKTPVNFIEAKLKSSEENSNTSGFHVMLPNGVRIGFDGEVTAALVQTVFSLAGSIKC